MHERVIRNSRPSDPERLRNYSLNLGSFLKKLGIVERAEMISKKMNFSDKANIYYRLEKLIGKQFMGDVFKVVLLTNNKTKFKIGF